MELTSCVFRDASAGDDHCVVVLADERIAIGQGGRPAVDRRARRRDERMKSLLVMGLLYYR